MYYDYCVELQVQVVCTPAYTFSGKHIPQLNEVKPGPGAYCPEKVNFCSVLMNINILSFY